MASETYLQRPHLSGHQLAHDQRAHVGTAVARAPALGVGAGRRRAHVAVARKARHARVREQRAQRRGVHALEDVRAEPRRQALLPHKQPQ